MREDSSAFPWNVMVPELTVFDFDKSVAFYTELLGFKIRYQRQNPSFAYITLEENIQLMLEEYQDDGWNTGPLDYPLGRGINFQMEVSSLTPIENALRHKHYPFYEEREVKTYTMANGQSTTQAQCLIQDPDGYLLRFVEVVD